MTANSQKFRHSIHVAVDATMLSRGGGLKGFANILQYWLTLENDLQFTVFASRNHVIAELQKLCPSVTVVPYGRNLPSVAVFFLRQLFLGPRLERAGCSAIFSTNSLVGRTRLPQLVHHRNALWFEKSSWAVPSFLARETKNSMRNISYFRRKAWNKAAQRAIEKAAVNIFVSHYLLSFARVEYPFTDNCVVVHNGISDGVSGKFRLPGESTGGASILAITSDNCHKNNEQLIYVLGMLKDLAPSESWRLTIVGKGEFLSIKRLAHTFGVSDSVDFAGFKNDGDMATLLDQSLCLFFPSKTESFGNPPLEAMTRGCPVVASRSTAIPEVCGAAALLNDPNNTSGFVEKILRLNADEALRDELIAAGYSNINRFDWSVSASKLACLIRKTVNRSAATQ